MKCLFSQALVSICIKRQLLFSSSRVREDVRIDDNEEPEDDENCKADLVPLVALLVFLLKLNAGL